MAIEKPQRELPKIACSEPRLKRAVRLDDEVQQLGRGMHTPQRKM